MTIEIHSKSYGSLTRISSPQTRWFGQFRKRSDGWHAEIRDHTSGKENEMFGPSDCERERRESLREERMSQGEYLTEAVAQYAAAYGAEDTSRAWILSPFDTWEPNPYYVGPPVPYPDADESDWRDDGQGHEGAAPAECDDNPETDECPF